MEDRNYLKKLAITVERTLALSESYYKRSEAEGGSFAGLSSEEFQSIVLKLTEIKEVLNG
jgi:hypothetical protein